MSDLTYIQQAQEVKITGQDTTGTTVNYVTADTNGNLSVKDYADGTPGSGVPPVAILIGGSDGTNLRSVKVSASGVVSIDGSATTQPISAASLPLPTGAATSSLQTTGNASLSSIDSKLNTLGQKTMAASVPVVFPSDQTITTSTSPLPATGSKFSFGKVVTSSLTTTPIEATTYTEQTSNGQRSIASASASDASAGTGARTVIITYYDQTGAGPFTETLTLNGTTGVNTVNTNICFIENIKVATVGSTGSNVGILTLYTLINKGGTAIGTIAATDNQTFWTHHYVPISKICYISGFSIGNNSSSTGAGGTFVLKVSTPTVANTPDIQVGDFCTIPGAGSTNTRNYQSPIQITGPARVRAYVTPYATSSVTQFASFDFIDN